VPRKPKRTNKPNVGIGYLIPSLSRERNERLQLKIRVEGENFQQHKDLIRIICPEAPTVVRGDELVVNYQLNIDYFGGIVEKLQALLELAKAGVFIQGSLAELRHGESLILDIADLVGELPSYVATPDDVVVLVGDHSEIEGENET